jgi:cytochrome P450
MTGVIDNLDTEIGMKRDELDATAMVLIIAGSETTATTLSTATWLLCKDPERMKKVVSEVRGAFATESEITMSSVNGLKYMIAVLSETLRILPPVSGSTVRMTDEGGNVIAGRWIPGKVSLSRRFI